MHLHAPKLAFYGDDFTGATDTLATVARAGYSALLFLRIPTERQRRAAGQLDCLGIAGAARSMQGAEQQAELQTVGHYMAQLGAPVTHYKTCSTFDSAPHVGSIGVAASTLRKTMDVAPFMPIVGGQPNLHRYCVFGNVFAAFQAGGQAYRLDRHPTMSRHPVTPMDEADLRRHLARQGLEQMALIEYPSYDLEPEAFDTLLDEAIDSGPDGVLFDVDHASHLPVIGRAIWQRALTKPLLAIGPSSVAQALLAYWRSVGDAPAVAAASAWTGSAYGPVFVLSGSMSPVTASQIQAAISYERIAIALDVLMSSNAIGREALLSRITESLAAGRHVLAYTSAPDNESAARHYQPSALAKACGAFLSQVLDRAKPRRIGVAGGDTSSYAIKALDAWGLSYKGQVDAGAALCCIHSDQPHLAGVEVMLKGGQMGSAAVFERLLD